MGLSIHNLQIGNILRHYYAGDYTVSAVIEDQDKIYVKEKETGGHAFFSLSELEPIRISEDYLEGLGFSEFNEYWIKEPVRISKNDFSIMLSSDCNVGFNITYIHELQNLFTALTNKPLLIIDANSRIDHNKIEGIVSGFMKDLNAHLVDTNYSPPHKSESEWTNALAEMLENIVVDFGIDIHIEPGTESNNSKLKMQIMENTLYGFPLCKWPKQWLELDNVFQLDILPDLLVHDDSLRGGNYLAIEIRMTSNCNDLRREWDWFKLQFITQGFSRFDYGLYLEFDLKSDVYQPFKYKLFGGGKIIQENR